MPTRAWRRATTATERRPPPACSGGDPATRGVLAACSPHKSSYAPVAAPPPRLAWNDPAASRKHFPRRTLLNIRTRLGLAALLALASAAASASILTTRYTHGSGN